MNGDNKCGVFNVSFPDQHFEIIPGTQKRAGQFQIRSAVGSRLCLSGVSSSNAGAAPDQDSDDQFWVFEYSDVTADSVAGVMRPNVLSPAGAPGTHDFATWRCNLDNWGAAAHRAGEKTDAASTLHTQLAQPGFPVTDLFILVHGLNNTHDDAASIYHTYMNQVSALAKSYGMNTQAVGTLEVFWPSVLSSDSVPSPHVLNGVGLAEQIAAIHAARPGLRLHLMAHSLGTIAAGRTLARLRQWGVGGAVRSVFLIQGALPADSFAQGRELCGIETHLGGPIVVTTARSDLLMQSAALAMAQQQLRGVVGGVRAVSGVISKVFGAIAKVTPYNPRETHASLTRYFDEHIKSGVSDVERLIGARPAAIAGIDGVTPINMHRRYDDTMEVGTGRYPFNAANGHTPRGVFVLNADYFIAGHDEYKIADVAFVHLVASGLVVSPGQPRRGTAITPHGLQPDRWMGELWPLIKDLRLNELTLLGSHDAGTGVLGDLLPLAQKEAIYNALRKTIVESGGDVTKVLRDGLTEVKKLAQWLNPFSKGPVDKRGVEYEVTDLLEAVIKPLEPFAATRVAALSKTQSAAVSEQLERGARYLDLRVAFYQGRWVLRHADPQKALGTYSLGAAHFVGAIGETLPDVLDGVEKFLSVPGRERELIILKLSHGYNIATGEPLNPTEVAGLLYQVESKLGPRLIRADWKSRIEEMPLGTLVHDGRNVLCLFNQDLPKSQPEQKLLEQYYGAIAKNDYKYPSPAVFSLKECFQLKDSYADNPYWMSVADDQRKKFQDHLNARAGKPGDRHGAFLLSWTATLRNTDPMTLLAGSIEDSALSMNQGLLPQMDEWINGGTIQPGRVPNIVLVDHLPPAMAPRSLDFMRVIRTFNELAGTRKP